MLVWTEVEKKTKRVKFGVSLYHVNSVKVVPSMHALVILRYGLSLKSQVPDVALNFARKNVDSIKQR